MKKLILILFSGLSIPVSGQTNVVLGYKAGNSITTGAYNSFTGYMAGMDNTVSGENVFTGYAAGRYSKGGRNTFTGFHAGYNNSIGSKNTFTGHSAGTANTTGLENVYTGCFAGTANTTGFSNSFIGYGAGGTNKTGSLNIGIGYKAGYNEKGKGKLYIANSADAPPLIYGNLWEGRLSVNTKTDDPAYTFYVNGSAYTTGNWIASDRRFKKNLKKIEGAMGMLAKLNGYSYYFKTEAAGFPDRNFPEGKHYGFVAQELQKVLPELVRADKNGYLAVNYDGIIPVIVEAIKEKNAEIAVLKQDIAAIKAFLTIIKQKHNRDVLK